MLAKSLSVILPVSSKDEQLEVWYFIKLTENLSPRVLYQHFCVKQHLGIIRYQVVFVLFFSLFHQNLAKTYTNCEKNRFWPVFWMHSTQTPDEVYKIPIVTIFYPKVVPFWTGHRHFRCWPPSRGTHPGSWSTQSSSPCGAPSRDIRTKCLQILPNR